MKILFAGYRNPHFITVTEYAEKAFAAAGAEVRFFSDRKYILPGRLRQMSSFLEDLELRALNRRLLREAAREKPDMFFACGGIRILPSTLLALKNVGIKTALWSIDPPREDFEQLVKAAPHYDHIFCGGSEAMELFRRVGINNALWLPFACDPGIHKRKELTGAEAGAFGCDLCFVGSVHPGLYPVRVKLLESISDMDLKVWGPGVETIPDSSPLKKRVAGAQVPPESWLRIYSSAKIALCMHYSDPGGKYPCYQASPRVFEVMACGAFLLCDAQKDVTSLFEDGKHLVLFHNAEELREKAAYYLANPEKREAIARAGRAEVLGRHTYLDRIKAVLEKMDAG